MAYNSEVEQLLESLIKMVGKLNQDVDNLQKRVTRLEHHLYISEKAHKTFILQKPSASNSKTSSPN